MSQKEKYFYNIKDQEKGILRELGDGIKTRIFPGEQAMVSIVNVDPNAKGSKFYIYIYTVYILSSYNI